MGGRDKGLAELAGQPLIAHVAKRIAPQAGRIFVSANRNLEYYAALGYPVIQDDTTGHDGPLAGILATGRHAHSEWLLVVPCDTPFLPADLVARLQAAALRDDTPMARARDAQAIHYVIMLLRRDLLDSLATALERGERSVKHWQAGLACAEAFFADPGAFANLNTAEDLARAAFARDLAHAAPVGLE